MIFKQKISHHLFCTVLFLISVLVASPVWAVKNCVRGDCENGFGIMELGTGAVYEGEFQNGKTHGKGTYLWSPTDRYNKEYTGAFLDDSLHGYGVMHYANGSIYKGLFKNNERHGTGKMSWPDGQGYVGQWKKGKYSDFGFMKWSNGGKYVGQWDEKRSGLGAFRWSDGALYLGNWGQGKREGRGRMILLNGETHAGLWKNGELSKDIKKTNEDLPDSNSSGKLYLLFMKEFAASCLQGKKNVASLGFARVKTKDTLNLRSQPSFGNNIVKKLPNGAYIVTNKSKNDWVQVVDTNCSTGWVKDSYLVSLNEEVNTWTEEQIVNAHVNNRAISPQISVKKRVSKNADHAIKGLFNLPKKNVDVSPPKKKKMVLKSISTVSGEIVLQLKFVASGRITKAEYFTLKEPQRLVIDLPGKWGNSSNVKIPKKNWWLEDVKIGLHEDKLRVVCYIKTVGELSIDSKPTKNGLNLKIRKK